MVGAFAKSTMSYGAYFSIGCKDCQKLLTEFFSSEPDRLIDEQDDKDFVTYTTKKDNY